MKDKGEKIYRFINAFNIKDLVALVLGVVLDGMIFAFGKEDFSLEIMPIIVGSILTGLIMIVVIIVCFHNSMIRSYYDRVLDDICSQIGSSRYGHVVRGADNAGGSCSRHRYHCCVASLIESNFYKNVLNKTVMSTQELSEYNLISDTDFDQKEKEYFKIHPNGEIWIISNALETEIDIEDERKGNRPDLSLRQSMEVVKNNIKDGGKYIQFVSLGIYGEEDNEFLKRRQKYWEARLDLPNEIELKKAMPVIRIDSDFTNVGMKREIFNDPDWAFMIKLTSTIIFVDENEHFSEGYFCFRPEDSSDAEEYERRTILFVMPNYCMLNDIVKDLRKIKEDYMSNL